MIDSNMELEATPKTIESKNPFDKWDNRILTFMTTISKNIYNCSVYCGQVYDTYSNYIFNDLNKYVIDNISNLTHITNSKLLIDDEYINNIREKIHTELYNIIGKYHSIYSKNKFIMTTNNNIIRKFLYSQNKINPILNHNYGSYIKKTFLNILKMKLILIDHETFWYVKDFMQSEIKQQVNWIYAKNFTHTKDEILNRKPVTFKNTKFINDVKNNKNLIERTFITRIHKKKNIEDFVNEKIEDIVNKLNSKLKNNKIVFDEKKKFKMDSNQFIIKKVTRKHIYDNSKYLPLDIIDNIIDKAYEGYISFLELKKRGINSNRQNFLGKNAKYNLFYSASSRKIITKNNIQYVRLNLGSYIADNYINITKDYSLVCVHSTEQIKKYTHVNNLICDVKNKDKKLYYKIGKNQYIKKTSPNIIDGNYMYITLPTYFRSKENLLTEKINANMNSSLKVVEISPMYDNGYKYKVSYKYQQSIPKISTYDKTDINNYLFIDLGIVNLLSIYDPNETTSKHRLLSGSQIVSMNYYYNNLLDKIDSTLGNVNKQHTSKRKRDILIRRENKITQYMRDICSWFINEYIKNSNNVKCVVVGYNINWKNEVNFGKSGNRKFYQIPFKRLLNMLRNKLNRYGVEMKMNEESYTSKCDALALEEICKHDEYLGNRSKRGLFASSIHKYINADLNGAINIGRKYMSKIGVNVEKINEKGLYNPIKIKTINCEVCKNTSRLMAIVGHNKVNNRDVNTYNMKKL